MDQPNHYASRFLVSVRDMPLRACPISHLPSPIPHPIPPRRRVQCGAPYSVLSLANPFPVSVSAVQVPVQCKLANEVMVAQPFSCIWRYVGRGKNGQTSRQESQAGKKRRILVPTCPRICAVVDQHGTFGVALNRHLYVVDCEQLRSNHPVAQLK
jgi:hypothetical protein